MLLASTVSKLAQRSLRHAGLKRTFFASSTDHTNLVANAKVHLIGDDPYGKRTYILLPDDTDLDLALKVDKLHLARLHANQNMIYGAQVVQRSLGTQSEVCKSLLDAALKDARLKGEDPIAMASLEGFCKWIRSGIEGKVEIDKLKEMKENDEVSYEACKAIATGIPRPGHSVVGQGTYRDAEKGWVWLAHEFVDKELSSESELYKSNGGTLQWIDTMADMSREGLIDSGGSMARFIFKS